MRMKWCKNCGTRIIDEQSGKYSGYCAQCIQKKWMKTSNCSIIISFACVVIGLIFIVQGISTSIFLPVDGFRKILVGILCLITFDAELNLGLSFRNKQMTLQEGGRKTLFRNLITNLPSIAILLIILAVYNML